MMMVKNEMKPNTSVSLAYYKTHKKGNSSRGEFLIIGSREKKKGNKFVTITNNNNKKRPNDAPTRKSSAHLDSSPMELRKISAHSSVLTGCLDVLRRR